MFYEHLLFNLVSPLFRKTWYAIVTQMNRFCLFVYMLLDISLYCIVLYKKSMPYLHVLDLYFKYISLKVNPKHLLVIIHSLPAHQNAEIFVFPDRWFVYLVFVLFHML